MTLIPGLTTTLNNDEAMEARLRELYTIYVGVVFETGWNGLGSIQLSSIPDRGDWIELGRDRKKSSLVESHFEEGAFWGFYEVVQILWTSLDPNPTVLVRMVRDSEEGLSSMEITHRLANMPTTTSMRW